jgi:thiamine transport system permease protein
LQLLVFSAVALVLWRWRRFGVAPTAPGAVTATTTRFQRLSAYGVTAILVAPLAMLAVRAFTVDGHTSLAGWRVDAARRPNAGQGVSPFETIGRSLFLAAVATAIATPLGAAAATGCRQLVRAGANRTAQVLEAVTLLPLACSAVTVGLGLLITYDSAPFDWRSSWIMVPLGQALVALPLVTRVIRSALDAQPVTLLDAAATLGVAPTRAWQSIELAGVRPAVAAAAGLAAAVSLGDFGAASVLSRSGGETAPVAIARLLSRPSDVTRAQGFALALMLAAVTMVLLHVADRDGALDARRS